MQQSQYIHIEGTQSIVIFIHGIVEGPNQFLRLMNFGSSAGYSVASLLIQGHGLPLSTHFLYANEDLEMLHTLYLDFLENRKIPK